MGGETRGNADKVFETGYEARKPRQQSFMECVNITHTTWMFHHAVWKDNGGQGMRGEELAMARFAAARMGYNFHVPNIAVKASSTSGQVDVNVNITQIGVAPFYYDLSLRLSCSGMSKKAVGGIDTLVDQGASMVVSFTGVPATEACLKALTLTLDSSYAYTGRPIKFAQGNGALSFALPLPGSIPQPSPSTPGSAQPPGSAPTSGPNTAGQSSADHPPRPVIQAVTKTVTKVVARVRKFFKRGK